MEATKPNPLTTVTTFPKAVALILFIALPFTGFYLGTKYQRAITVPPKPDILINNPDTKPPQNNILKLEFKDLTVTLEKESVAKDSGTLFSLPIKKVDGPVISNDPAGDLFKEPIGAYVYYSNQTDGFYDLQPGGYSMLRLTDSEEMDNLSKSYEKEDNLSHAKIKFSCSIFHYPVGSVDALSLSCTTTITVPTGGDESTTANCYLPLETGTFLAYEQKSKPVGINVNMCEKLSRMGVTGVTWLRALSASQELSSPSATWKNYKDETLSFDYPGDWEAAPMQIFGSHSEVIFSSQSTTTLSLSDTGNYNNGTGKAYASLLEYLGVLASKAQGTTVGGQKALRVVDAGELGHVVPFEQVVLFSPDGKSIVNFYYQADYYPATGADEVLDRILSTFKFSK